MESQVPQVAEPTRTNTQQEWDTLATLEQPQEYEPTHQTRPKGFNALGRSDN